MTTHATSGCNLTREDFDPADPPCPDGGLPAEHPPAYVGITNGDALDKLADLIAAAPVDGFTRHARALVADAIDLIESTGRTIPPLSEFDTGSSASCQHYIETGRYLRHGEAWTV